MGIFADAEKKLIEAHQGEERCECGHSFFAHSEKTNGKCLYVRYATGQDPKQKGNIVPFPCDCARYRAKLSELSDEAGRIE